jgi:hypothetical protein
MLNWLQANTIGNIGVDIIETGTIPIIYHAPKRK